MSDVMLFGVLRMPYELAMSNELSRMQFHDRAQQAADRIEQADAINAQLLGALKRLIASMDAHSTLHADDGDDIARMVEWEEAEDEARGAIRAAEGEA